MYLPEHQIQESRYQFPYHYIPRFENGGFSQSIVFAWGHEYLSYVEFLLERLRSLQFTSLLDVGCGDGRLIYELRKQCPAKNLVGIDTSISAIRHAQVMNPEGKYILGDISDHSLFVNKFDVITLVETLEHIPLNAVPYFVESLAYHLKDSGTLIITVPTTVLHLNPKHFQHFSFGSLQEAIDTFFIIDEYFYLNKWSVWTRFMQKLFVNRLYILNEPLLQSVAFKLYKKFFLEAEKQNAKRLCVFCHKRSSTN
jgi:2-polyprenyl-3-methyl-5-hydroxy-6-metoxy-1,4-benzoquinol methylase